MLARIREQINELGSHYESPYSLILPTLCGKMAWVGGMLYERLPEGTRWETFGNLRQFLWLPILALPLLAVTTSIKIIYVSIVFLALLSIQLALILGVYRGPPEGLQDRLNEALATQHWWRVIFLLASGVQITQEHLNQRDNFSFTPLMHAMRGGDRAIVAELIRQGADVVQLSPLMREMLGNSRELIVELIRRRVDVDHLYPSGETVLMAAVRAGHAEIVQALIERGVDVNFRDGSDETAIMVAAQMGAIEALQALLARQADVNYGAWTALMRAADGGHVRAVQLLIEAGAQVNVLAGSSGRTPLMFAVAGGHLDVVRTLIDRGADINLPDSSGGTALMVAAEVGSSDEMLQVLLACRPNLDASGVPSGRTALMIALNRGHIGVAQALIMAGADVNLADSSDRRALTVAYNYTIGTDLGLEMMRLLLERRGIEPNFTDAEERTLLIKSVIEGRSAQVVGLLARHINRSHRDAEGVTAREHAVRLGREEIVHILS